MKKILCYALLFMLSFGGLHLHSVSAEEADMKNVELSEEQIQELNSLYDDMFTNHKEIITKYVEYGVLTKEKADKIMEKLDKKQEKLQENGYVPNCDSHKKSKDKED
ncbi:DUF2680 domain-containing protein [Bacillaceae bacterium S4-13-58]